MRRKRKAVQGGTSVCAVRAIICAVQSRNGEHLAPFEVQHHGPMLGQQITSLEQNQGGRQRDECHKVRMAKLRAFPGRQEMH